KAPVLDHRRDAGNARFLAYRRLVPVPLRSTYRSSRHSTMLGDLQPALRPNDERRGEHATRMRQGELRGETVDRASIAIENRPPAPARSSAVPKSASPATRIRLQEPLVTSVRI